MRTIAAWWSSISPFSSISSLLAEAETGQTAPTTGNTYAWRGTAYTTAAKDMINHCYAWRGDQIRSMEKSAASRVTLDESSSGSGGKNKGPEEKLHQKQVHECYVAAARGLSRRISSVPVQAAR
ncbi:hypothetical protein LX32DRAFT_678384 [Colletotrichum zoysiae]|uniref:Uncharacterized protein n=1 Tax=Colletotrichum zoysiae TaxID=1216348 RepID=A0AAD9HUN6_9PEZI|nr:hypothetical protein LX32DRAFT_678384 [Colletotrichum zoysiae]